MCHTNGGETWPWVAVEIPRSNVKQVKIINRANCCWDRVNNMKFWVGDYLPTSSDKEFTSGGFLGIFRGPGTSGQVIDINSQTGLEGRYVILQTKTKTSINLLEIAVFGEPAHNNDITPNAVKMSSQHPDFPGHNCIDNNVGTMCHTNGGETWPWVAVEIPRSNVKQVKIINRANCCWDRVNNMKFWVGDYLPTSSDKEFTSGGFLGIFRGPGTSGQVIDINSQTGLEGRYVILQTRTRTSINLLEIAVFGEPAHNNGITPKAVKMSSQFNGNYPGHNCIDGNLNTMCHTKNDEALPWVAVEIPRSTINQVRITNRVDCCGDRTKNMKVWVGDQLPTTAGGEYSSGRLLGTFKGPGTNGQKIDIQSKTGLQGRYVILQMSQTIAINLADIEVFGS